MPGVVRLRPVGPDPGPGSPPTRTHRTVEPAPTHQRRSPDAPGCRRGPVGVTDHRPPAPPWMPTLGATNHHCATCYDVGKTVTQTSYQDAVIS